MSWLDRFLRRMRSKVSMEDDWEGLTATYSGTAFQSLVTHGYHKNELMFACISKTANTASQVGMKFYKRDKELEIHPAKQLIQAPNPFMSEFDFWVANIIYQKLAGVAYWEKERSNGGQLIALWPLRPDWITPIKLKDRVGLAGYEYRPDGGLEKETLPAEDVVAFQLWDPLGMFEQWPPVATAARVGDVDNATTDYVKMFMQKGGTPPGILKTKQRIANEDRVEEIRARWRKRYGGKDNWLDPAVLDEDADYQQIGSSFKDMGFETLDARSEARICMVLDVPPILIGAKIGLDRATYSNYGEARRAWWEDSLVPMYENFEDVVINQILNEFEPGITPAWDYSKVSALQEDRNSRWQRATVAWNAGAITNNEFRAEVGLPERLEGDVFKSVPVEILGTEEVTESEPDEEETPKKRLPKAIHMEVESVAGTSKAAEAPDAKKRRKHEKLMTEAVGEYFDSQMKRIKKELANANGNG
jgi:HK97 family phage portal protein